MSDTIIFEDAQITFLGIELGLARIIKIRVSDFDINITNIFDLRDIKKVFIDMFFDDEATVVSTLDRFNIREDHGELFITAPGIGSIYFVDATFRSKTISRKHDETRNLIYVQFLSAIGPQKK